MKRYDMNIVVGEVNASEAEDGEWVSFADHNDAIRIKDANLKLLRHDADEMTKTIGEGSASISKFLETIGDLHRQIRELRNENDGYKAEIADMRIRTGYGSMEERLKHALTERDKALSEASVLRGQLAAVKTAHEHESACESHIHGHDVELEKVLMAADHDPDKVKKHLEKALDLLSSQQPNIVLAAVQLAKALQFA